MTAIGIWTLTMSTPMGEQTLTLTVADATSATVTGPDGAAQPAEKFRQDGDRLTWKLPVKKPIPLSLHFDVTVSGDTIEGKFRPGMFPQSPVHGVRVA